MNILHIVLLFALSGIWGGSFIFMRHLAPIFGAVITADLRLLIAGAFLLGLLTLMGTKPEWRKHWKQYLIAGAVNSGAPALLYSFAALHIPASISVIINSMAPIFVVMFSIIWLGEKLSIVKVAGLLLGTGGVALVASVGAVSGSAMSILAILACVGAACCYGLAGVYIKKYSSHIKPRLMAMGSQALVGAILFPLIFAFPPAQTVTANSVLILAGFAVLCSAIAYLIYYYLVSKVGPTKTLTVTFLMPAFGMLWSNLFLGERITTFMIVGTCIILLGTYLVYFEKRTA